jgi:hypothetical protein
MEEMSLQLYGVQQGIEDVLDAVRNPAGKRKCSPNSEYDNTELQSPTTRQQLPQKQCDASPTHGLMQSRHAAATAQDALDTRTRQCAPRPTAEPLTIAPPRTATTNAEPEAPLPEETAAAPEAEKGWRTATSKATRWKMKAAEADNTRTETAREKTPRKQNGERLNKIHQPTTKNYRDVKTWADVVRSRGINVQIVLGNGNLGQATPVRMTGERRERRGGTTRRLRKRSGAGTGESGERGALGRGNVGPEVILLGANKGGKIDKNGGGRVEDRGERPGKVASERTGLLE